MKDLDKLFDDISKTELPEFPFNDSEIRKSLTNIDNQKNVNIFNKRGVVVMSIFSSILIVFVSLMLMQNTENHQSINQVDSKIMSESNIIKTENIENEIKDFSLESGENKHRINSTNPDEFASNDNSSINIHDITNSQFNNTININNELSKIKDDSHTKHETLTLKQETETDKPNKRLRNSFNSVKTVKKKITWEEGEKLKRQIDVEPIDTNVVKIENGNVVLHYYDQELSKSLLDSIDIPFLTDDELERINIRMVDCGYIFLGEQTFPDLANNIMVPEDYGYPKSGLVRSVYLVTDSFRFRIDYLKNPNWVMNKTVGIFPLGLNLHRHSAERSSFLSSSFGQSYSKSPKIIHNNPILSGSLLKQIRDINENGFDVNSIKIYYEKEKYQELKAAIPIFLKVKKDNSTGYILLKFPATKNFISLLPARYKFDSYNHLFSHLLDEMDADDISKRFKETSSQLTNICNNLKKYEEFPSSMSRQDAKQLAGIEKLILTKDEAEKIGIIQKGDTLSTTFEDYINVNEVPQGGLEMVSEMYGYDTTKSNLLLKSNAYVLMNNFGTSLGIKVQPTKYSGWDYSKWSTKAAIGVIYQSATLYDGKPGSTTTMTHISQSPFLRSDTSLGKYIHFDNIVRKDTSGNYKPLIQNLLPVNISWNLLDGIDTINIQVDIWFYVSKEFAELLPERYRTPILNELDIISKVEDGSLAPDDACKALKGEISYLGLCRMNNEILSHLSLYPNPVTDNSLNISLTPKSNCKLKIELYNYEGKYISTLKNFENYAPYKNSIPLSLGDIGQGVYILYISDEKGNSVTEKFVKIK